MRVRQKDLRLVDHQVGVDPHEELLVACCLEDHVLVQHEMAIYLAQFVAGLGYQAGVVEGLL